MIPVQASWYVNCSNSVGFNDTSTLGIKAMKLKNYFSALLVLCVFGFNTSASAETVADCCKRYCESKVDDPDPLGCLDDCMSGELAVCRPSNRLLSNQGKN